MTQEALKLALECAERCEAIDGMYSWSATITAIKKSLAQTQEPVGCAECERLKDALKRASGLAEHFERAWYLRGDEIELLKAQPQEPDDIASILACRDMLDAQPVPPSTEQNFCPRCGKRTADLTTIHTCTPPQE